MHTRKPMLQIALATTIPALLRLYLPILLFLVKKRIPSGSPTHT